MKSSLHKWLLLFLMLWLPLQGAAAAVLSVCAQETIHHHTEQMLHDDSDHHHGDCHKQQNDGGDSEHLLTSLPCDDNSCDAYSHTPILPHHAAAIITNNRSAIISYFSGFVSFVPDQPQHPPLTA